MPLSIAMYSMVERLWPGYKLRKNEGNKDYLDGGSINENCETAKATYAIKYIDCQGTSGYNVNDSHSS